MRIDFHASPAPTLGVEWEFALVDRTTRDLVSVASEVHELAGGRPDVPPQSVLVLEAAEEGLDLGGVRQRHIDWLPLGVALVVGGEQVDRHGPNCIRHGDHDPGPGMTLADCEEPADAIKDALGPV